MGTSTRKQREVEQREQRLLDTARAMLIEQGFAGLSMDRLAEATEYSKGTVYQHFSTKEDLVTALAVQSHQRRLELFDKARRFDGLPRERMHAIGMADELFARLHPHFFRSELVVKMANLEDRASPERREALDRPEIHCIRWIREIVDAAIARGDLALPAAITAGDLTFGVMSMAIGAHTVMLNFRPVLEELEITSPFASLRRDFYRLLDGFGWRPLTTEHDYEAIDRRIAAEVFADEWKRAGLG